MSQSFFNSSPVYRSFDDAFSEIESLSKNNHIVFVIDEYPYLAKSDPSISSRLQHVIDHRWQESGIFLILCGSSMSFMQNQVLGYESPLYGRRTGQFMIEPLTYGVDELDLLEKYASVFGKGTKYHYYIFSLGGFTNELKKLADEKGVKLITADDMYK